MVMASTLPIVWLVDTNDLHVVPSKAIMSCDPSPLTKRLSPPTTNNGG
jgi:hypothetical protein